MVAFFCSKWLYTLIKMILQYITTILNFSSIFFFFSGARVALFEPYLSLFPTYNYLSITFASFLSGVSAVFIGNPLELLKVQSQSHSIGFKDGICKIYKNHGLFGFWRGKRLQKMFLFLIF